MTAPPEAPAYRDLLRRRGQPLAALPADDPVVDSADPALRRTIGQTWSRRAHEELKAAMAFALLARELLEVGAPPEAIARVSRAVGDEVRHAELLRALATRYLGEEVAWPPPVAVEASPVGTHPLVRASLHAVTLCCVNETIAAVFIEASHEAAQSASARATLGLVLADEVEHGRAGWVYLGGVRDDRAVMKAVEREMASIVRNVSACWFDTSAIALADGAPGHGLLSNDDSRHCVVTALRDLVLPGFARLGLDVTEAASFVHALP